MADGVALSLISVTLLRGPPLRLTCRMARLRSKQQRPGQIAALVQAVHSNDFKQHLLPGCPGIVKNDTQLNPACRSSGYA